MFFFKYNAFSLKSWIHEAISLSVLGGADSMASLQTWFRATYLHTIDPGYIGFLQVKTKDLLDQGLLREEKGILFQTELGELMAKLCFRLV